MCFSTGGIRRFCGPVRLVYGLTGCKVSPLPFAYWFRASSSSTIFLLEKTSVVAPRFFRHALEAQGVPPRNTRVGWQAYFSSFFKPYKKHPSLGDKRKTQHLGGWAETFADLILAVLSLGHLFRGRSPAVSCCYASLKVSLPLPQGPWQRRLGWGGGSRRHCRFQVNMPKREVPVRLEQQQDPTSKRIFYEEGWLTLMFHTGATW